MSRYYSADPSADYDSYDREQEEKLKKYPVCDVCEEYITDEGYYLIEGVRICEECINDYLYNHYRVYTDEYFYNL